MELVPILTEILNRPPIPYNPAQQSLKAWATYCLRDRGFKVVYAQAADFAIEQRDGTKIYFKVTEQAADLDPATAWIVHDRTTNQVQVIPPA